jgi:hypothetical protein
MTAIMDGELERLGERIAEQAAHLDAAMHRLLADLREFDARGGWHVQGAMSCAHWLAWRVGWDLVTARERVRVARRLEEFSTIDDALRRGEVSYSKVRAMMRVATPANEALLLDYARLMTASSLEKLCRKYALVQRHGQAPHPVGDEQHRYVRRRDTEDGMVTIEAVLHPEEAELVWTMLNHAATQLAHDPNTGLHHDSAESRAVLSASAITTTTAGHFDACSIGNSAESRDVIASTPDGDVLAPGWHGAPSLPSIDGDGATSRGPSALRQRADAAKGAFSRADALVSLAQGYLRGDRPQRSPIEITLTIAGSSLRADTADPLEAGELGESFLSTETARRLSCDAGVVEVIEDAEGMPLSVGRKRRTIAGALKRALHRRDGACVYPGCTNRLFLEGHHIEHWADGGETSLKNTALLCSSHHRYVHEYGFAIELGPDQRPCIRTPYGQLVPAVPAPPQSPGMADLGWPRIRAANQPLAIDAGTIAGPWDGTPVAYGTIVGHLVTADGLE